MTLFTGLSAFPITPANCEGDLIPGDLARLVARASAAGVDSIGLLGSTGSYMYLDRTQRRRAVSIARETAGTTPLIVGVGALRTDDAAAFARDAAQEGAAGLLLAPVSYMPLSEAEVFAHFETVAAETGLPVCIYSNPVTTGFTFSPDFVGRLSAIPGVSAVKLPMPGDGNVAADLARYRHAAPDLSIGYSGDWGGKAALLAGADCWYSVLGGLLPELAVALAAAARTGDAIQAERLDLRLSALWSLWRTHGSLRIVYAMARMLDLTDADPPRPIAPPDAETLERVRSTLQAVLARAGAGC
ncbi:dihydrodipicolinate synthase family protein [Brevundimonas sp. NPDC092305]|uniref:dihydrodipicolinate synthase family protein n=1 Tax=Brevundimonas sp. NPDC092305 TaxID=3363957 RepID=UPI003814BBD9